MIVSKKLKIGIFFIPKTGSMTITKMLQDIHDIVWSHDHDNYDDFLRKFPEENPAEYKFFSFYRDPVDRLISAHQHAMTWGFMPSIKFFDFLDLMIEKGNPLINSKKENEQRLFMPQTFWLDHDGVIPLDFRDFERNAKYVLSLFQDYDLDYVPKFNYGNYPAKELRDWLLDCHIEKIKQIYKQDYDFFNKHGISFT